MLTIEEAKRNLESKISAYNAVIAEHLPMDNLVRCETEIKVAVRDCLDAARKNWYDALRATEEPLLNALVDPYFMFDSVKFEKNEDKTPSCAKVEPARGTLDLLDFMKKLNMNCDWQYKTDSLAMRWTLRNARELELSDAQIRDIQENFRLHKKAVAVTNPGDKIADPVSNKQCRKALQELVDLVLYKENPEKKDCNLYEVQAKDIAYVDKVFVQMDRKNFTNVRTLGKRAFFHAVVGILSVILRSYVEKDENGKYIPAHYTVEFKRK